MDRNDVLDLLAVIASIDRRTVGEAEVITWTQLLAGLPKDDCLEAILAHRREQPGVWLEPGHVIARAKAAIRDRLDRTDPDQRDTNRTTPPIRFDRYGYIDKTAPEQGEQLPLTPPPDDERITLREWEARHRHDYPNGFPFHTIGKTIPD